MTATPAAAATWRTAATSSTDAGKTAGLGRPPLEDVRREIDAGQNVGRADDGAKLVEQGRLPRALTALEALGQALLFDGVGPVSHGPGLAARLAGREDLAGIAQSRRVEGELEPLHEREVGRREDERHEVGLLEADAVLAGDRAADLRADLHDLGPRRHHTRFLTLATRVVEDVGVEVAIARVEDVANAQAVGGHDLVHAAQHVRELGARDHAVHDHVGG